MSKTILILLDACGFNAATQNLSYLELLTEQNKCAKYRVLGQLPSSSRPMYQTLLTGVPATVHGTVTNAYRGDGYPDNIFRLCRDAGLVTAAAAYNWFAELYNSTGAFQLYNQRYQLNSSGAIQYGIFYRDDSYPDSHLYADAEFLRTQYHPDFLLIHPMGIDFWGHQKGSESDSYLDTVMNNGEIISTLLPGWLEDDYNIVITADHGMDSLGRHGGNIPMHREVPLYIISKKVGAGDFSLNRISHLSIAPLVCRLLGIPLAEKMQESEVAVYE